jgi:Ran GTPase-activating protein (RanGAP) involved in mRNA processing and transport
MVTLAALLPRCGSLTSLDLQDNEIDADGCKVLSAALPACSSLASLDLSGNSIGADGCVALSAALSSRINLSNVAASQSLTSVSVSDIYNFNLSDISHQHSCSLACAAQSIFQQDGCWRRKASCGRYQSPPQLHTDRHEHVRRQG